MSGEIEFGRDLTAHSEPGHGKVTAMISVSCRIYEDGSSHIDVHSLDPGSRRMIPNQSWCMPEHQPTRGAILRSIEEIARTTRTQEAEQPPLPW